MRTVLVKTDSVIIRPNLKYSPPEQTLAQKDQWQQPNAQPINEQQPAKRVAIHVILHCTSQHTLSFSCYNYDYDAIMQKAYVKLMLFMEYFT